MQNSTLQSLFSQLKKSTAIPYKLIYLITTFISLLLVLWMSNSVAISGDEHKYIEQSKKVYKYYSSGREDKSAVTQDGIDPQHYNSQSFDVIIYSLEKWFNIEDTFKFRHNVIAFSGWLVALFISLIAINISGFKTAILTLLLLFSSPRFLGHLFNNHRDIPLALSFVLTTYFLLLFLKKYPKISVKYSIFLIFGIASAYSLRLAGGILLSALTIFYISLNHLFENKIKKLLKLTSLKNFVKFFSISLLIISIAYFLGILIWPYGLEGPIKNSLEVFNASSNLGVSLNQLFEGKIILSNTIPWYYTPKFMIITIPVITIIGFAFYFIFSVISKFRYFNKAQLIIIITALSPLIYTTLKTTNDYGGWRHFIFVYPFIVLISAIGITLFFKIFTKKVFAITGILLFAGLLIKPISFIIQNHPYHYVYFNEFVGGVGRAYKTYETDYSCNGLLGGVNWLKENVISELKNGESIKIVSNYHPSTKEYLKDYNDKVSISYTRYYEKYRKQWDYAIFYCAYISPHQLKNNLWPPKGTIHTEDVDGFPIAAVVKRISDEDLKGFNALKKNKTADAKKHFKAFLELYPENEEVLEGYARACLNERKFDSTIIYADSSLIYNPRQIGAIFLKASALNYKKEYKKALAVCDEMINIKKSFAEGRYQKGIALKNLNKPNEALKEFQLAITYKKDYYEAYMRTGDILINYKKYNDAINKVYKKVLAFKKRDLNAIVNTAKCYHFLKQNNNAEELLKEIPKANKNNLYVVMLKARIELGKGNFNSSAQLLNRARNIKNNSELFVIRALFVLAKNNKALAKQYLDKAVELDSTNREASELLKKVQSTTKPKTKQTQDPQKSIMFQKNTKKKQNPFNLLQNK